jgi:hypothetical protein
MPLNDFVNREAIVKRIAELQSAQDEIAQLEAVLDAVDNAGKRGTRARGTSATATRPNGNRAARGSRPRAFMEAVTDAPGITASNLAAELDCNVNYIYKLAKELSDEGKVEKRGMGFFPVEASTEAEPQDGTMDEDPQDAMAEGDTE